MIPIIWTRFPHSKLATFLSLFASVCIFGGIAYAISGMVLPSLVPIVFGIGLRLLAGYIAKRKERKLAAASAGKEPGYASKPEYVPPTGRTEAAATVHRCPNCGCETEPGDRFCIQCGGKL